MYAHVFKACTLTFIIQYNSLALNFQEISVINYIIIPETTVILIK